MCQRLLSVDLVACFVLAFTPSSWLIVEAFNFPDAIAKHGPEHFLIEGLGNDTYHSEPLAQQAMLHVTTSFTAAILHLLKPAHIVGGGWSVIFVDAVYCYLDEVVNIYEEEPDYDWSHDAVVLALKTLLRESPTDVPSLQQTMVKWRQRSMFFRRGEEQALNRFFDYICSDS
jgi:hypothetical protein